MGESTLVAASAGGPGTVAPGVACTPVAFDPADIARRDTAAWNGLHMDAIEIVRREPYAYGADAACHLLIMAERGERDDGETLVEGLPRSTLRNFTGRLSFVPRGHRFRGWQNPRVLTRVTYFAIDPSGPLIDPELRFAETEFKPRLFFRDPDLWTIGAKLKAQRGLSLPGQRQYAETLSILLAHELMRLNSDATRDGADARSYVRGGLAAWQRNRIADYVEGHFAENVSLATLAELARLSPFHFSRAFKQSFGMPPHRYLTSRRMEHAKRLLADDAASITQIGMAVGFGDTSSFTSAFRRHTGVAPTVFRRSLD